MAGGGMARVARLALDAQSQPFFTVCQHHLPWLGLPRSITNPGGRCALAAGYSTPVVSTGGGRGPSDPSGGALRPHVSAPLPAIVLPPPNGGTNGANGNGNVTGAPGVSGGGGGTRVTFAAAPTNMGRDRPPLPYPMSGRSSSVTDMGAVVAAAGGRATPSRMGVVTRGAAAAAGGANGAGAKTPGHGTLPRVPSRLMQRQFLSEELSESGEQGPESRNPTPRR